MQDSRPVSELHKLRGMAKAGNWIRRKITNHGLDPSETGPDKRDSTGQSLEKEKPLLLFFGIITK